MEVLKSIDIEALKSDRLQLWGEAAHYEAQGESIVLDEVLWPAAGIEREKRRTKDPYEDLLASIPESVFAPDLNGKDGWQTIIHRDEQIEKAASSDLLIHVLKIPKAQLTTSHGMRLANAMKKLGWKRTEHDKVTINGKSARATGGPSQREPRQRLRGPRGRKSLTRHPGTRPHAHPSGGGGHILPPRGMSSPPTKAHSCPTWKGKGVSKRSGRTGRTGRIVKSPIE
jgi:predicted P-loop ATPase